MERGVRVAIFVILYAQLGDVHGSLVQQYLLERGSSLSLMILSFETSAHTFCSVGLA